MTIGAFDGQGLTPFGDLPVGREKPLVLSHLGRVVAQLRQAGVVGLAQCLGIRDAMEMADRGPRMVQPVVQFFQRQDAVLEITTGAA